MAKTDALSYWMARINEGDLAILGGVVRKMQAIVSDEDANMGKISQTILSDAGLTTKVLRLANSVAYAQQAGPVNTVSKACILLGVENLRNMTLSVRIVDELLGSNHQQPLLRVMAMSLQTALLARSLWGWLQPRQAEEAFIAGLLMDLGEAAYFSLQDKNSAVLVKRWQQEEDRDSVTQEVLGVSFRELGRELAKSWNLGVLTQEVMKPIADSNISKVIGLSRRLSDALIRQAKPEEILGIYQKISTLLKKDVEDITDHVQESLEALPELIQEFGAEILMQQFAPKTVTLFESKTVADVAVEEENDTWSPLLPEFEEPKPVTRQPDLLLQLGVLREMILIDNPKAHINSLVSMTIEGIYRGVAMDRVLIAVLSLDGRVLSARLLLSDSNFEWKDQFRFDLKGGEMPLFTELMTHRKTIWLGREKRLSVRSLGRGAERIYNTVAEVEAFAGAVVVGVKAIGLIYADRLVHQIPLQSEDFMAFRHFVHQLNLTQLWAQSRV